MLASSDVAATIAVSDMAAAQKFYEEILGLSKTMENPGGVYYQCGSGGVFVYPSEHAGTNKATSASWRVDDVDSEVAELKSKGVSFEHYENIPGAEVQGEIHVMGDMKSAWFKDPDGNILNIVSQTK